MADWKKNLFELSDTKILIYVKARGKARYSDLLDEVISSRSTLASSLSQLQRAGLLSRTVRNTRPVQTEYTLTEKGVRFVDLLTDIKELLDV